LTSGSQQAVEQQSNSVQSSDPLVTAALQGASGFRCNLTTMRLPTWRELATV